MNAFVLEYIFNSTSILLLIFIILLFIALLYLNLRITNNERLNSKTNQEIEMLNNVFKNAIIPCVIIDNQGVVFEINDKALDLLGKNKEDLVGNYFDFFSIVQSSKIKTNNMKKALKENKRYSFKSTINKNNKYLDCIFEVSSILEGNPSRYLISILPNDQNESQEHEKNLQLKRIDKLEDIAGVGFFTYNHETNETIWSRGMYKLLEARLNETVPSLSFISDITSDSNNEVQEIILAIRNLKPYSKRIKIHDYLGNIKYVDFELMHQEETENISSLTLGTLKEVHNLNELLKNIPNGSKSFNLINPSDSFLMALTKDNVVLETNESFLKYLNKTENEVINKDFFTLLDMDNSKLVNNSFVQQLDKNSIVWKPLKTDLSETNDIQLYIGIAYETETE